MKKLLTILVASLLTVSCATTKRAQEYPRLHAETVQDTCEAVENYSIRVMPMPVQVLRFQANCAGVKDLLLIIIPSMVFTAEQKVLTTQLALSYYIEYLNREQVLNLEEPSRVWQAKFIKREVHISETNGQREMFYYSVSFAFLEVNNNGELKE
jgi:hypothetical protein